MRPSTHAIWINDPLHFLRKLKGTIRICRKLFMARTFGKYEHSGWNGEFNYAKYSYHGDVWCFPTDPYDTNQ